MFEGGCEFGFDVRAVEVGDEGGEEIDVGAWCFEGEIRLCTDDEMGCVEGFECRGDLRSCESWIERDENCSELEESVGECCEFNVIAQRDTDS